MKKIRVVIADDHPIFARGLRQVLMEDPAIDVIAEARDGDAALGCIERENPDVTMLDIDMPRMGGFEVVKAIRERKLSTAPVFLTMHQDRALFDAALRLDVRGYVLKDSALSEASDCVRSIAAGKSFVSPLLTTYLLEQRTRRQALFNERPDLNALTAAERQVLQLVAAGKSNAEIAQQLFVSIRTVEHHRSHICGKLNLKGRDALIHFAVSRRAELI